MNLHRKQFIAAMAASLAILNPVNADAEALFSGLSERLEINVRLLSPLTTTACESARWRVERLFRDADKSIVEALRALGYYEPVISKTLSWDDDCWHASFDIEAGEPVRLRTVNVEIIGDAEKDPIFLNRILASRPTVGEVFDHGAYGDFKKSLLSAASFAGYFDADYEVSSVTVVKKERAADLTMKFDGGEKYRFGEVSFTQDILRDSLLQGFTDIKPGEAFTSKKVSELYEALNGSSYFASVSIRTDPLDTVTKIVPVAVELTSAKRRIYSIGAGISTDLGPTGRLGFANRRINDRGHQFESKLFGSEVNSELSATYRWPRQDPRKEWFSIVTGFQHANTDTSERDAFKLGFLQSKSLPSSWLQTRYIDYAYEDYTVADQSSISELVILGTNFEKAKGRALSRATNGYRMSFDVRGASDTFGSDTNFLQFRAKIKRVFSLGDRTRFLARASVGLTTQDELEELPASVRFFAGGDNSVRGYGFETLGPTDVNGNVIGGSHMLDASFELDYLFRDKWAVAAFVDSGDAFDNKDLKFNTGVGIGIRWYSPVGPLRLDFAHPLDNPDESFRIHIGLGPDL